MDRNVSSARASIGSGRRGPGRGAPVQHAKDFKGTVKMLWKYMEGLKLRLLLVIILVLICSGLSVLFPMLIGRAVDAMGESAGVADFGILGSTVIILGCCYFIDVALIFLRSFIMAGLSQSFVNRIRRELFAKLQKLPLGFFDSRESGDIMSRLTNDMDTISGTVGQAAVQLVSGVLTVLGTFVMMVILSPILALTVLLTVPLIYLLTKVVTKRTRVLYREQQALLGILNSHMEESITGIATIRAYGRTEYVTDVFERCNEDYRKTATKAHVWSGYIMPLLGVINNFGFVLVSAVGGVLAVHGSLSIGDIASFVSLTRQFVRPLNEIANTYNTFLSAIAGAERVFEIFSEPEEAADREGAIDVPEDAKGEVEFRNVSFGYRPDKQVLDNVSFKVDSEMRAAFVGPTGAGKTTIINLLTRFYDVSEGSILLDERDLRDYKRDSIRSTFGVVLQETYLFEGTIMDNIRYGKLDATDEEVIRCAKMAGADMFITRLRDGYYTSVSDNGGNLSAGQRQLLALARAVLCDSPILILDEATSNVDTMTELRIQQTMAELMRGRTTFVIAHRLGTIRDADIIMVVDEGKIIESGNHGELMRLGGIYSKMYTSQTAKAKTER
ncbi:MAG: ABC transporter ATP-binding protein [Clostridiales bacterium]|nr:ABC transporter ATP-binding protein [Clostridiales bacterium]